MSLGKYKKDITFFYFINFIFLVTLFEFKIFKLLFQIQLLGVILENNHRNGILIISNFQANPFRMENNTIYKYKNDLFIEQRILRKCCSERIRAPILLQVNILSYQYESFKLILEFIKMIL